MVAAVLGRDRPGVALQQAELAGAGEAADAQARSSVAPFESLKKANRFYSSCIERVSEAKENDV